MAKRDSSTSTLCALVKNLILRFAVSWLWTLENQHLQLWHSVFSGGAFWQGFPHKAWETPNPITFCYFKVYFWSFTHGPGLLADEHRTLSKAQGLLPRACNVVCDKRCISPLFLSATTRVVRSLAQIDRHVSQRKQEDLPENLFFCGFKAPGFCWLLDVEGDSHIWSEVIFRYN